MNSGPGVPNECMEPEMLGSGAIPLGPYLI